MYNPIANSYFSGMGIMDMGLMDAGVHVQQSVDMDKDAIANMKMNRHRFGHAIVHADIAQMTVLDQPERDIDVFTYPCTNYSAIADIHNARTGDELYLHALRHMALRPPEMYVAENVPGMKKFKVVMEVMTKLPGYFIHLFCPVETTNWLPQRRNRLIIIGTRKPFNIEPPKNTRRVSIKSIIERNPEVEMPEYVIARIKGQYRDLPIIVDPSKDDIAPTCVAHYAKDLGTRLLKDKRSEFGLRPFSIREYARLQGVPDDVKFAGKRSDYKLIGNGVPKPMAEWIGQQAMRYFN